MKSITNIFKGKNLINVIKGTGLLITMFTLRKGIATGIVALAMSVMKASTVASPGTLFCEIEYPEM